MFNLGNVFTYLYGGAVNNKRTIINNTGNGLREIMYHRLWEKISVCKTVGSWVRGYSDLGTRLENIFSDL